MGFKVGYKYNAITKQYIGTVDCQQVSYQSKTWLIPPYTTFVQPVAVKENNARLFDQQKQEWYYVTDNRNKTMYLKQKSLVKNKTPDGLFDPIPAQYTLVEPPDHIKWYKFKNKKWQYYFEPVTDTYLYDLTYKKKCQIGYGGIFIVNDNVQYKFETTQDSITMCNSTVIRLQNEPETTEINWKSWVNDKPAILVLTKAQFTTIFSLGLNMVNESFTVEGNLNAEIASMTSEQLADETFINEFKEKIETDFNNIQRVFELNKI